ncbi:MAG: VCBS repeat-containing protein [Paludibacteraceae bacterium]|nr:VCBS repeat-containing protein [Paludibacteraceae bacterium]
MCLCLPLGAQVSRYFDMKLLKTISVGAYQGVNPIFVADLDGDNLPELVTVQSDFRDNAASLVIVSGVASYKQTRIHFGTSYGTPGVSFGYACGAIALARTQLPNGSKRGSIYVVAGTAQQKLLYAYAYYGYEQIEEIASVPLQQNLYGNPAVVDFDGDGRDEVFVGNEVFDAYKLNTIGSGTGGNVGRHMQHDGANFSLSVAADVLSELPGIELICGNQIYSVHPHGSPTGVRLVQTVGGDAQDGSALVADFTRDNRLDILVRDINGQLSLYDPAANQCLFHKDYLPMKAYPAVGDIDGDSLPEIVGLKDNHTLAAYKYVPSRGSLRQFWTIHHTDVSAQTSMTLFDFNADGRCEIVYRDETSLRIINGSGKNHITGNDTIQAGRRVAYNLATFQVSSVTKSEYPVVADVNGDGKTEIVVGGTLYEPYKDGNATINIFGANIVPWTVAPPRWTSYVYRH